jgi:hypothetical protein
MFIYLGNCEMEKPNYRILKKVTFEDWQKAFPEFTPYSKERLFRIVGPFVIGIELLRGIKASEQNEYSVVFSSCFLWDFPGQFTNLLVGYYFSNKAGGPLVIKYHEHDKVFKESAACVKTRFPFTYNKDVKLSEIFSFANLRIYDEQQKQHPDTFFLGKLMKMKFYAALYANNMKAANTVLKEIAAKKWTTFPVFFLEVDAVKWLEELKEDAKNRDVFMLQVQASKQNKIKTFKTSELIDDIINF